MKRFGIILLFLFTSSLFVGCDDLLDELLADEQDQENTWWEAEDTGNNNNKNNNNEQNEQDEQDENNNTDVNSDVSDSVKSSEAYKAYLYLNEIRANPGAYSNECNVDLSSISPRPVLTWNETLAKVAAEKAQDMADRNYFSHVDPDGYGMNIKIAEAGYELRADWYSNPSSNFFESLVVGSKDGEDGIRIMIEDKGLNPPGHRNHLLGLDDFWSDCTDIGIGYVYSDHSDYPSYMCVLIAKHDF